MMKGRRTILYIQDKFVSTDEQADKGQGLAYREGNSIPLPVLNCKRKDDFTIEELQQLPAFQRYNEEQLTLLLDTLKCFTRIVWQVHLNGQRKSIALQSIINPTQKAA